jgi:Rieske Fe-S protein
MHPLRPVRHGLSHGGHDHGEIFFYGNGEPVKHEETKVPRRFFLGLLGKLSILAALLAEAAGAFKAFIPQVLYEPPSKFKVGRADEFPEGMTFLPEFKLYLVREGKNFHAISAVCTHLYCVVDWKPDRQDFSCSCHGSVFSKEGVNLTGPAPKPLPLFALSLSSDGQLVVDSQKQVGQDFKFSI